MDRFWKKVQSDESGCWEWSGAKTNDGYGKITVNGEKWLAHRYSWKLHFDEHPKENCVLHTCDNPSCVHPGHLFLGTQKDNALGCSGKGRRPLGSQRPTSKMTEEDVIALRFSRAISGMSYRKMAKITGYSPTAIRCAVIGETWRHVK